MMGEAETNLVTVIAVNKDGSPLSKGTIACDGFWSKHGEEDSQYDYIWAYPFKADSRGAAVFNAPKEWKTMTCYAWKDEFSGSLSFQVDIPVLVKTIVVSER